MYPALYLRLEHLIVPHAAGRQVGRGGTLASAALAPACCSASLSSHSMLTAPSKPTRFSSIMISSTLLASRAVPAVTKFQPLSGWPIGRWPPSRPARRVLADHLHALDVGAVDAVAELADELHHRDALPFHVRAVEVEADHALVAGLVHGVEVIAGRLDVAHGPLAGMAFQVEGDAVLLAGVEDRAEALDQQFQADLAHVGNGVAVEAGRQRREQEEVAPAVGRRADEAGQGHLAVLQLAQVMGQADAGEQVVACACSWISRPTSSGTKYGSVRGGLLPLSRQAL